MSKTVRVTVWNEYRHEKTNEQIAQIYPDGMHNAIGNYLKEQPGFEVHTATLDEPEHGLTEAVLCQYGCSDLVGTRSTWRGRGRSC